MTEIEAKIEAVIAAVRESNRGYADKGIVVNAEPRVFSRLYWAAVNSFWMKRQWREARRRNPGKTKFEWLAAQGWPTWVEKL